MSISPRTRREAILLLDVAASQWAPGLAGACLQRRVSAHAVDLAGSALIEISNAITEDCCIIEWYVTWYAEAAGLLRDGWSPGDPVVRL